MKEKNMKKISETKADDLRPEYDFDYSEAKPNPYAAQLKKQHNFIQLAPDVAEYYKTDEQVNNALRAIIKQQI